jgi:hypothetical protein
MRAYALLLMFAGCSFQVRGVDVAPDDDPSRPAPPIAQPFPPASEPTDVPDLAQPAVALPDLATAPDLTTPPDLTPATIVCGANMDCDYHPAAGTTNSYICQNNSSCDVDCRDAVKCTVECLGDADCECRGKNCTLVGCTPKDCKGDVFVCNQECGG